MAKTVTVSVPATTANLGPGFDCLGLALDLRNTITLCRSSTGLEVTIKGEGKDTIPADQSNLVVQAVAHLFQLLGLRSGKWRIIQENHIPVGSGLGSSAAAVLGGLLAGNAFLNNPMSADQILLVASRLEGHPDNVAPALHGGLTLVNTGEDGLLVEQIPLPVMQVVVVLPHFELSTSDARAALPPQVPLTDAVFNAARTALLMRALENGNYDKLSLAMQDRLHQPYRIGLIPGMAKAFEAAKEAGASGVALSGAGPGVVAFAPDGHDVIGAAITRAFAAVGVASRTWILPVDRQGCLINVSNE